MANIFEDISNAVRDRGYAEQADVETVMRFAEAEQSALAFAMAGDLIQLLNESARYELARIIHGDRVKEIAGSSPSR
jgi:hypothetical protein